MTFAFANSGSGPSAGGIGWFNFGAGFTILPGTGNSTFTGNLRNGVTVSFDMELITTSGVPTSFSSTTAPDGAAYFGNITGGYTGLNTSYVILLSKHPGLPAVATTMRFRVTNIVVADINNNVMPNYTMVIADGQTTTGSSTFNESLVFTTNGGDFEELTQLGNTSVPILNLNGQTASIIGTGPPIGASFVVTTDSPTEVLMDISWPAIRSTQGIAFGFAVTQVELYKNVDGRRDSADQFSLDIAGTPSNQSITSGNTNGVQNLFASVNAIPDNSYTLTELLAPGSVSSASEYTQTFSAVNLTPGGTVVTPVSPLPMTYTPILGDFIQYTVTNTPYPTVDKTVSLEYAQPGDTLIYTVYVNNVNSAGPVTDVLVIDANPPGTTYAGNLNVSVAYTGTDPASGITLTSIPAGQTATVSWDVTIDNEIPQQNPILNTANISGDGYSYETPTVETLISFANLKSPGNFVKSADKAFADIGDTITYTLTATNTGNVDATNVVFTDTPPNGTTFVEGSLSTLASFTGTSIVTGVTLVDPILPGDTVTLTYQVKVTSMPVPNPIENIADVDYTYTVDPAIQDGVSASATTLPVLTQVNHADLVSQGNFVKSVDKEFADVGDILTYSISIINTGNIAASNIVVTDVIPQGTTYVAGSVTVSKPFTGDPTTVIQIMPPINPNEVVTISFEVKVVKIPSTNPIPNQAKIDYTYIVNPNIPTTKSVSGLSNIVETLINNATLTVVKAVDKKLSYIGDIITYAIAVTNTGNVGATNVVITDQIPVGTSLVPGSVIVSVPYTGNLSPGINLTNPIAPSEIVSISFKVLVNELPNPNPINNKVMTNYTYTVDPLNPNGVSKTSTSNIVSTRVLRYNFSQQVTDIINSIAFQQAALAAIADAEGRKIQAAVAMDGITKQELMCINKSVQDMIDSIALLESVLKQKLNVIDCQINPDYCS